MFFTPKALHNLAQGITLGTGFYLFIPTLKALNRPLTKDIINPFRVSTVA